MQISRKALYLDRDDFLPFGYKVSAKFKAPASTPPRPRGGPHPNDRSQPSPAKKRKTSLPQHVVNLADDDDDDDLDYYFSEEDDEEEEEEEEEGQDDVLVNTDPADEYGSPPYRPSVNVPDSRPSTGTPSSSGTLGASSSMERREKRKERDPMASVLESLTTMMANSQRKHEQQMAELSAHQDRERIENLRLHEESCRIQMENSQMMQQTQQTTNMLLAAFMRMNPDLLQTLPTASPSAQLIIGSGASGSLLSGSSTREAEATPMVHRHVQEDSPRSPAMHPSPAEVIRPEAASVVPESPENLEIDALEIGGGSDELGFKDAVAGSDT